MNPPFATWTRRFKLWTIFCEHPYGINTKETITKLYDDCEDGGPLNADRCIYVMVCQMNRELRLKNIWLQIKTITGPKYAIHVVRPKA